jgi:hypothetical protein
LRKSQHFFIRAKGLRTHVGALAGKVAKSLMSAILVHYRSKVRSRYRIFGDTSIRGCCEPNEY